MPRDQRIYLSHPLNPVFNFRAVAYHHVSGTEWAIYFSSDPDVGIYVNVEA